MSGYLWGNAVSIGKEILSAANGSEFIAKIINSGAAPTITTGTVSGSPFKPGASVNVPFTVSAGFNSGNVFTAQLSDAFGNFKNAVAIGTLAAVSSGTISAVIPVAPGPGTQYRIRVIGSNPLRYGQDNGSDIIITVTQIFIASNASWKYLDNGSNQGTAWRALSFSDGTWKTGIAPLGDNGFETTQVHSVGHATTYFRKKISITNKSLFSGFEMSLIRDDGAVVYVNGKEVWRSNMPGGTIYYNTLASSGIDPPAESQFINNKIIPASAFVSGDNEIAVEIHQASSNFDMSFNMKLAGIKIPPSNDLIAANSSWRYLDNGADLGDGSYWTSPYFDDAAWKTGNAELGYGDGGEATVVSYGPSASSKYITTYFRKKFNADASEINALQLELLRDDGAVVYLNGVEVFRNNLPDYSPGNAIALSDIDTKSEKTWLNALLNVNALVNGENIIGVEIHQSSAASDDISFNLKLTAVKLPPSPPASCTASGTITREVWTNVTGNYVSQIPVTTAPSSTGTLSIFEGPSNIGDNYGDRIKGFICPPVTGSYTFWIASDDDAELWLSTNGYPSNKVKIASVTGYTYAREWNKYASQKSGLITLTAGTKYYIETLHKEAIGGDHIAVGWRLPGGVLEQPIPGMRLSPYTAVSSGPPTVSITSPANNTSYPSPSNITINAAASSSSGTILKVEFFQGTVKLGEDLTAPYSFTWMNVSTGNYALTAKATDNNYISASSPIVNVIVTSCAAAIITPAGPTTFCSGSVLLKANTGTGFMYQWKKNGTDISGATGSTYTASTAGDYQVKIIQGSCISYSAPTTVKIQSGLSASITAGGPTTFCSGSSLTLYANTCSGYTYQWRKNSVDISGANASTYLVTTSGSYQIRVTLNGVNAWSSQLSVTVNSCKENSDTASQTETLTSIAPPADSSGTFQMKVFPNPNSGLFTIEINTPASNAEKVKLRIVNILGQEVYNKEFTANSNYIKETVELDNSLNTGVYTLQIMIGNKVENTNIVLSK